MNHYEPNSKKVRFNGDKSIVGRFRKMKFLAIVVGLSLLSQIIYPNVCLAVTAGPSSPEFSSFEPVATTNMVNEFSGQFIYNLPVLEIPGASGGGYALSLAYHGGDGPEAEASWVGSGWTLNPGSIIRNKRGIPDDYKGKAIKYYNSAPKNWTIAATGSFGGEAYSLTGTISQTLRYNYYKGFGVTSGIGFSFFKGLFSLGYSVTDGSGSFSADVNPSALLGYMNGKQNTDQQNADAQSGRELHKIDNSGTGRAALGKASGAASGVFKNGSSSYIHYLLTSSTSPYNLTPYSGSTWEGYVAATEDPGPVPIGFTESLDISYTSQKNDPKRNVKSYGYMYSGNDLDSMTNNSGGDSARVMDYTLENASTFNLRDAYLPVPSSTPDAFMVSGEGLSGGFRLYNDRIGVFSPNYIQSNTTTHNFGLDLHLGLDVGVGADDALTVGHHSVTVQSSWPGGQRGNGTSDSAWFVPYDFKDSAHVISENMFFRFNNDLGGQVTYDSLNIDNPDYAIIEGGKPNLKIASPLRIQKDTTVVGQNRRGGRSSYIAYHTNREINTFSGSFRPLAFEQRSDINTLAGRADTLTNSEIADEIGEVSVVNEGGNRYTYGLPVYCGDERNLRRGLQGGGTSDKYLRHSHLGSLDAGITIGEELTTPYASQYLLTEITTPDYLDVNGNGPDAADFGGYTKFTYKRLYGNDNKVDMSSYHNWYKWRTPYNGMMFAPNRLSDNTDDMGSYQSGYKEVYYLDTIETKTHFAVFITGPRTDGLDAHPDDDAAALTNTAQGFHTPKCLTQIQLYAKPTIPGAANTLVKTIHFYYNYECWPHTVNSGAPGTNGKLTLKKVWFEYNGVVNAYISPYQFEYTYPTSVPYPSQYGYIQSEMVGAGPLDQTPNYTPYIDCWGNYQYDGNNRRQFMKSWVSQVPAPTFDPAAWQLKRIILPSGGEIHVQYEQNSYSYVQDRQACALVSLLDAPTTVATGSTFTINAAEVGATTTAEKTALAKLIKDTYLNKKIFFKFFYTLKYNALADWGSCNGDYVEGYVNFSNCYLDAMTGLINIQISGGLPSQLCKDYVKKEIGGKLRDDNCSYSAAPADIGTGSSDIASDLSSLASMFIGKVTSSIPGSFTICLKANPTYSYLRIPVFKKLGGGIRVKRLLMFNKGIDANSPDLYGTEYIYENSVDGTSYGVATNEPYENKGENPLVTFLPKRTEQPDWDRLIGGKDKEQFEGPLSWNALPSPSVGYSRIIKKNIYQSQATTTGYTVIDYNTVKDYPFDGFYPALGVFGAVQHPIQKVKDDWHIDFGILDYDIKTGMKASQGFCFIQNQMHGQLKSISDYRGVFNAVTFNDITSPPIPVSQKTYSYFAPGEAIPMFDFQKWQIYYDHPGRETDITIDRRSVDEHSSETRLTGDITVGYAILAATLWTVGLVLTSESDQKMSSIAVNKVVHYPCIMKSMTVMKDGYVQKSDYVAFDPLTTKPVLTTTYDGFNNLHLPMDYGIAHQGIYTAYNVPASANYQAMGQKAWNEKFCFYKDSLSPGIHISGSGTSYTIAGVNLRRSFNPGDLVAIHYKISGSTYDGIDMAHVTATAGNDITVTPTLKYNSSLTTGSTCYKVEILQSGYTNQLASSMDGVTVYGPNHMSLNEVLNFVNSQIYYFEHSALTDYSFNLPPSMTNTFYIQTLGYVNSFTLKKVGGVLQLWLLFPPTYGLIEFLALPLYPGSQMGLKLSSYYCEGFGTMGTGWLGMMDTSTGGETDHNCKFNCPNTPTVIMSIIKAQTTTYSDNWAYDTAAYGLDTVGLNHYESGMRGKWRPYETYVYRDSTIRGTDLSLGQRNYNYAGTIRFVFGRWDTIYKRLPDRWIRSNHIDAYSPNGHATQEVDAENVYSAAKYGYNGILPYMVAQNARNTSIHFESFENVYDATGIGHGEDRSPIDYTRIVPDAHTGKHGYKVPPSGIIEMPEATDFTGQGLTLRFWAKVTGNPTGIFQVIAGSGTVPVRYVARSGDWALYEADWSSAGPGTILFVIRNVSTVDYIFDDIRIQPTGAKATCYVYDVASLKLSAVLDDQHFATYYQYNGEGKLVRTLVETERGIKTVEESQYHIPMIPR